MSLYTLTVNIKGADLASTTAKVQEMDMLDGFNSACLCAGIQKVIVLCTVYYVNTFERCICNSIFLRSLFAHTKDAICISIHGKHVNLYKRNCGVKVEVTPGCWTPDFSCR